MDDKIRSRIKKLLKLSESSNPGEAANAARMAQEIMMRHGISSEAIGDDGDDRPDTKTQETGHTTFSTGKKRWSQWHVKLASAVSQANGCLILLSKHWDSENRCYQNSFMLIGYEQNRQDTIQIYNFCAAEIDRLCEEYCKAERSRGNRPGKTGGKQFRLGAIRSIRDSLDAARRNVEKQLREEAAGNTTALARVEKGLKRYDTTAAADYIGKNFEVGSAHRFSASRGNASAYQAGVAAGRTINTATKGRLGS